MYTTESDFKILYDKYFAGVFRYVCARTPNRGDAEDIVSEVFIAVWKLRAQLDDQRSPGSLIYAIARNKLCDYLRKQYKLQFLALDSEWLETPQADVRSNDSDKSVLLARIEAAVSALGEQYKKLFQLKYKHNQTYTQIAAAMNISEGNAKVLNNRLLKKVKQLCQKTEN